MPNYFTRQVRLAIHQEGSGQEGSIQQGQRANPSPQDEGPSKRPRVEPMLIVAFSSIESPPPPLTFLFMKEGTASL